MSIQYLDETKTIAIESANNRITILVISISAHSLHPFIGIFSFSFFVFNSLCYIEILTLWSMK